MDRTVLLAALALALVGPHAASAAPPPASADPKQAAQADSDFVLPPPHGSPKELATGGTRGIRPVGTTPAEPVLDLHAARPPAAAIAGGVGGGAPALSAPYSAA